MADIPFEAAVDDDPYTTATMTGQLGRAVKHPWEVIGGVAVLWKHFHMIVGGGYGYYFLPGPQTSPTPARRSCPTCRSRWCFEARRRGAGSAAAVALALGCDQETITLPEPPMAAETQQLVALYDMPTATLDTSNIDQVAGPTPRPAWRSCISTGFRASSPTCWRGCARAWTTAACPPIPRASRRRAGRS